MFLNTFRFLCVIQIDDDVVAVNSIDEMLSVMSLRLFLFDMME